MAVLPTTDSAAWALSRWRTDFPDSVLSLLPLHDAVARVHERAALHDLAKSIGIDCTHEFRIRNETEVEPTLRDAQKRPFPVLVRPMRAMGDRDEGPGRTTAPLRILNIADLRRLLYERDDLVDGGIVIEPAVPGQALAYAALYDDGKPVAEVYQERLREQDALSGISTLAQTIAPDGELAQKGRRILEALGWQGPALCEFVRTPNGHLQLRRVVGRLWNSLHLAIAAGVDVPGLAYRICEGERIGRVHVAEAGHRVRWMIGDAKGAVGLARGAFGPASVRSRLKQLGSIVDPRQVAGVDTAVFDRDDPMPFVYEMQAWATNLV